MISITDKVQCCGCNACGDICGYNAITFVTDMEGFWYPEIAKDKCTDCGLCEKVCPIINIKELKKNDLEKPDCYAAKHKNLEVVFDSTSGGLFSALAEKMYKEGGYVGGAIYDENFDVHHYISNSKQDLVRLRSSKYQQSNLIGFYDQVRKILKAGEKVLVCGCPCQMAALRAFLKKDHENLIIVDFICRGINSPWVNRKYRESLEKKYRSAIVWEKAKNKELGWRNLTRKFCFVDGRKVYITKDESLFNRGYLHTNAFCRPSCYSCQFKGFPRMADITLADFWRIEKVDKSMDDNLGTSLVMLNSKKGQIYYETIQQKIKSVEVPFESALAGNPALVKPLGPPKINREEFFKDLQNSDFMAVANKYFPFVPSKKQYLKKLISGYWYICKSLQFRIRPFCQFICYNFLRKNIKTNKANTGYLIPTPYTVIQIGKKANVQLNARLSVGAKKFRKSKLETRLLIDDGGTLIINGRFVFGYGSDIEVFNGGQLLIGGILGGGTNMNTTIICAERIEIGGHVMMGRNITIRDNNGGHYLSQQGYKNTRSVVIGNHVWLCEGCTIMPGVKIGDGAIVGAHAVVYANVPAYSLVLGNPAKVVQTDIFWKY
ncbi:MAG: Coenzyme F420 hydrogenase/dehydrogenase, beta subunit C-terminal domain [Bacteroidales bacterium]|jgi:acetyltransferase-like isoleucine patch superfamily enzyme/coenzyme F420-reducing hydrogenase beta subunit|nr:Coenzyme F420 hydrogenase/dehydrogenase, beta subunit C-terminal domain [Bacteroidales bacterium]